MAPIGFVTTYMRFILFDCLTIQRCGKKFDKNKLSWKKITDFYILFNRRGLNYE